MKTFRFLYLVLVAVSFLSGGKAKAQSAIPITVSSSVPAELNPNGGGAPKATPEQAAAFAWQEFIALNWPAGPQEGKAGQRETPSMQYHFGDPRYFGPLVWQTFRGKVEIFPGVPATTASKREPNFPPGYRPQTEDPSFGYDGLPQYVYSKAITAADPSQANEPTPWINLDETDEITLCNMYAGVVKPESSPGNSAPNLIRFLAKANRSQYVYVAQNSSTTDSDKQWWYAIPGDVVTTTSQYLEQKQESPPAGSADKVSLPFGTIEIKAAWRPLNPSELASGRFHTQTVRFYETSTSGEIVYRHAVWGLVALHIIQKTPSAPYFIYATFEQADNILTADGKPVEDENGNEIAQLLPKTATTPQVLLLDPRPTVTTPPPQLPSQQGAVVLSDDPSSGVPAKTPSYCGNPGSKLYYRNNDTKNPPAPPHNAPSGGYICIDRRDNAIPQYAIDANVAAHQAIAKYLEGGSSKSAPWLYYKLINVQYYPYDKVITDVTPNGSLYDGKPPYTAEHPAPSSYYQANIVVETNRSLQLFSGGLSPGICTDWNRDGSPHKNTYYGGHSYNTGGCMGCHGSQGQNPLFKAGDFSVILARGSVSEPEPPSVVTPQGMIAVPRNRSLSQ